MHESLYILGQRAKTVLYRAIAILLWNTLIAVMLWDYLRVTFNFQLFSPVDWVWMRRIWWDSQVGAHGFSTPFFLTWLVGAVAVAIGTITLALVKSEEPVSDALGWIAGQWEKRRQAKTPSLTMASLNLSRRQAASPQRPPVPDSLNSRPAPAGAQAPESKTDAKGGNSLNSRPAPAVAAPAPAPTVPPPPPVSSETSVIKQPIAQAPDSSDSRPSPAAAAQPARAGNSTIWEPARPEAAPDAAEIPAEDDSDYSDFVSAWPELQRRPSETTHIDEIRDLLLAAGFTVVTAVAMRQDRVIDLVAVSGDRILLVKHDPVDGTWSADLDTAIDKENSEWYVEGIPEQVHPPPERELAILAGVFEVRMTDILSIPPVQSVVVLSQAMIDNALDAIPVWQDLGVTVARIAEAGPAVVLPDVKVVIGTNPVPPANPDIVSAIAERFHATVVDVGQGGGEP